MKVLFALDTYYPKFDGPARVVSNIATILTEENLTEVELIAPFYPKYKDIEPFRIHRCPSTSLFSFDKYRTPLPALSRKVKKLIKNGKFDIIHVHSPFTLGKYVSKLGNKYKIPVINTIHTQYKSDFERKLKSKVLINYMLNYILKVMNMADSVNTVSVGAAKIISEYGYKKSIGVIRNATDLKDTKDLTDQIKTINDVHNLNEEFIFLFVGRIVENKNIQFSIEALNLLKQAGYDNFKFIIIGEGNYKDELEKQAEEAGISDNVIFTGLVKDRDLLSAYYKRADLFLFPSIFDTCGLVVLEAGSFGLPSVTLSNTCASELLTNDIDGFIISHEPAEWSKKFAKLIENPEILQKMKEITKNNFNKSWKDITLEYLKLYERTIDDYKKI